VTLWLLTILQFVLQKILFFAFANTLASKLATYCSTKKGLACARPFTLGGGRITRFARDPSIICRAFKVKGLLRSLFFCLRKYFSKQACYILLNKKRPCLRKTFHFGWIMGFEPTAPGTTNQCSNQLSYTHHNPRRGCKYKLKFC
jgi:hypothetical protein